MELLFSGGLLVLLIMMIGIFVIVIIHKRRQLHIERGRESGGSPIRVPVESAVSQLPPPVSEEIREWLLAEHNALRAEANVPPLVWDVDMEQRARRIASTCVLDHTNADDVDMEVYENLCYPGHEPGGHTVDTLKKECMGPIAAERQVLIEGKCQDDRYASNASESYKPCGHYQALIDPTLTHLAFSISPCSPDNAKNSKYVSQFGNDVHVDFGVFLFR